MEENFDQFSEDELQELKDRFFQMKNSEQIIYFDTDDYEKLIDHFFEIDDIKNIEAAIEYALEQHPGHYDFLLKKAHLLALYGEDEKGLQILDSLTNLGDDTDYFMIRGTILSNLQKYREAIDEYTKAINRGQDLEEVYSNIAFEYENLEQFDKAIEYLSKVLEINPNNEAALNEAGICFEMTNQSIDSVEYFNTFLDKHPYSRSAWFNLAIAYNSLGKNRKAINAYEFSLAIDDNQPSAFFNIANIYAGLEQHNKAIQFYKETLEKEAPDAITFYYMGESYEKLDLFDEALNSYMQSYELNNEFHEAQLGLARCHFMIGNEEKAYAYIGKAVTLDEPFPLFWSIRSLKLDELGFYKLAKYAILQLIKHKPKQAIYSVILAIFMSNHDIDASVTILKDARIIHHGKEHYAMILFLLGLYQIETNNEKSGLLNFEEAIKENIDDFQNPLIQSEMSNISHQGLKDLIEKYGL